MSSSSRSDVKKTSKKKGALAGGAAVITGVGAATIGLAPLTVAGIGATGYLTWRWWKHRAKNGIKF